MSNVRGVSFKKPPPTKGMRVVWDKEGVGEDLLDFLNELIDEFGKEEMTIHSFVIAISTIGRIVTLERGGELFSVPWHRPEEEEKYIFPLNYDLFLRPAA